MRPAGGASQSLRYPLCLPKEVAERQSTLGVSQAVIPPFLAVLLGRHV